VSLLPVPLLPVPLLPKINYTITSHAVETLAL